MKKSIVVLGLLALQSSTSFATVGDAQGVVAPDSVKAVVDQIDSAAALVVEEAVKADSAAALVVEDSLPAVPEAKVFDDTTIADLNEITELPAEKPLPELRETTIGVSVGVGGAWYNSKPVSNQGVFCFRGGLNFDIPIGQWFSLQPELLFATRGGGFDANSEYGKISLKENLFYFDVPINCKFSKRMNISKTVTGRGFFSVGPVLSLGVYGKSEGDGVKNKVFQNDSENEMEHAIYRNFDFSFNFRIGYDFDAAYSVAVGYQLGLFNLMNDGNFDDNEKYEYQALYGDKFPEVRNSSLYISFGYCW